MPPGSNIESFHAVFQKQDYAIQLSLGGRLYECKVFLLGLLIGPVRAASTNKDLWAVNSMGPMSCQHDTHRVIAYVRTKTGARQVRRVRARFGGLPDSRQRRQRKAKDIECFKGLDPPSPRAPSVERFSAALETPLAGSPGRRHLLVKRNHRGRQTMRSLRAVAYSSIAIAGYAASTPCASRCASINDTITSIGGRAPPSQNKLMLYAESRWLAATREPRAQAL